MTLNELLQKPLVVGDGAMGTALMERGLPAGQAGETWNLERPEVVEEIHGGYLEAGADYVLTNTFGGNALSLARHGLDARTEEINRAAARIARRAAGADRLVLGDVGPTGELLEPYGDLSAEEAREAFGRQIGALAEGGVDAVVFETFESASELRTALEAAREPRDLPLIASMTFRPRAEGQYRNMMGEEPQVVAALGREFGCAVVGTNCGQGIQTMPSLVRQIAEATELPVICQPNAGLPKLVHGQTMYEEAPAVFEQYVPQVYEAGARIIGGCDGTTPEHIAVIRRFAESL
jgi:5-methyltetrahydrofolate--homocysteine methyltransferase